MGEQPKIRLAAAGVIAWLALPAPASAADYYLYCKGYSQTRNVISPVIVDSPDVSEQWDAYLKSNGFSGGGCRSSFKERDVVARMREDLIGSSVPFQPIQWIPKPYRKASKPVVTIPRPSLWPTGIEPYAKNGMNFVRYHFEVTNRASYPAELFRPAPDLPPCGANKRSSRTWLEFFDATGKRIYGHCALGAPQELGSISFVLEKGVSPPAKVYIVMTDRLTNTKYKSDSTSAAGAAATR